MSLQVAKNEQSLARPHAMSDAQAQDKSIKVLIPYDGSESAEMALDDLRMAGLPQALDAIVAVTNVWLPLSPYEITRAVSARRMRVLTAGASSFAPSLRDHEEQRVLSLEAERRISSIFPSGTVRAEAMQDTATVANEILRKAKQWGAELIIVGSNTSPSLHITDYAGPALKVAREAHCSVRIARRSDRKDDSPIRIIIGVDGSTSAADAVDAVADPTVRNIPLVASNPEAEFFDRLKDFRFADGAAFDFRGERDRSIGGKDDPLANSNQRGDKGFITTYEVERTIAFVGKFKLDWIFVKPPSLTEPYDEEQPHRFAPHFGRTLKSLNDSMKDRISDHAPIMVDLPLAEPPLTKTSEKRTIQTKN